MNPFSMVTRPARDLVRAVTLPLTALFVVGLTGAINVMTYHGRWWFGWVALGMGIAVLVAWARAARVLLTLLLVAWIGRWILRRHGPDLRAIFDAWVVRAQPKAAEVMDLWQAGEARLRGPAAQGAAPSRGGFDDRP
jgi:hypothetical protein